MTGTSFPTYAMPGALAFATDTGILYCYNSATASWSRVSRVGKQAYSAYGPAVDAQTTFTAFIDVPSLSVSWTADPLRLYRTTVIGLSDQQTNAANQTVAITDAANAIIRQTNQSAGINGFLSWNLPVTESGLSGVITRKARIFSTGATGRIRASTPNPFTILVEDIGAA
jgi:hypothetical protein